MDAVSLLLGHLSVKNLANARLNRLYDILAHAARKKNIVISWINGKPPTKTTWHIILVECFPLECLT